MTTRLLLLLLLFCAPLRAGLWDCDRPPTRPDAFAIITGKFDRHPKAWYAARATRLAAQLEGLPANPATADEIKRCADALPWFDDAAVAAFRLGDYDGAIVLLDRKLLLVDAIRPTLTARARDAWIRGAANEAFCLQYRWKRDGNTQDLRHARELLGEILAQDRHNSDARWALTEVEWLLASPAWHVGGDPVFPNVLGLKDASFRGVLDDNAAARANVIGCLPFLERRIVHEQGWGEVDVMYAYSLALALTGRPEESLFAWFRVVELIDQGQTTQVNGAPATTALKRALGKHVESVPDREAAEQLYAELRRQADEWHERRTAYALAQIEAGRHPDTHSDFWSGFDSLPPVAPTGPEMHTDPAISTVLLVGGLGGLTVVLLLILGFGVVLGKRTAPPPNVDEI